MLSKILSTIDRSQRQSLAGLFDFLRIPSVSTKPEHRPDMQRCADWLASRLRECGLSAAIEPTGGGKGHPLVLARNEHKRGRPTVLLYGHYDVQPAEPLNLWTSPPFEPAVREGAIYARGACDDKGQVWAHVQAIAAWQAAGGLPVNLICLFEGEEEIGSDHLEAWVRAHAAELRADVAVVSDGEQFAPGVPAIAYGLRGLVYMEVFALAAGYDLHSGLYGGAVPNPANALCEMLATLHTPEGRVNIPGFYDDVVPLMPEERQMWAELPFDESRFLAELGLTSGTGEVGYTNLERRCARPTCDINGLSGGYQGAGAKTIIPSAASAKVSMRLVPNQDPAKIQAAFEQAMRDRCPAGVKLRFEEHGLAGAVVVPLDSPYMRAAARAVETGFGKAPVYMREGGSIPVVGLFKRVLGIDTLLVGFGLPDDRVHSPNEKLNLDGLQAGTRTAAALWNEIAQVKGGAIS